MGERMRRWRVALRKVMRRVVYSRSSSQSIAAGAALGVFIGLTPTVGFQMLIAAFLATVFRLNRLAAVAPVWITNPFTIGPIYSFNFLVGAWLLRMEGGAGVRAKFDEVGQKIAAVSFGDFFGTLGDVFGAMAALGAKILLPLIIGSLIVALVCAAVTYPAALWAVSRVRRQRQLYAARRAQRRIESLEARGLIVHAEREREAPEEDAARPPDAEDRPASPASPPLRIVPAREDGEDGEDDEENDESASPPSRAGGA